MQQILTNEKLKLGNICLKSDLKIVVNFLLIDSNHSTDCFRSS